MGVLDALARARGSWARACGCGVHTGLTDMGVQGVRELEGPTLKKL